LTRSLTDEQLIAVGKAFSDLGAKPEFTPEQVQAWIESIGVEICVGKSGQEVKTETGPSTSTATVKVQAQGVPWVVVRTNWNKRSIWCGS
jgi:hypothetical protein